MEPGGLERLLYQSNVVVKGVAGNRLDAIGKVLGEGLAKGHAPDKIGRDLRELLGDPVKARQIAVTETNRAMSWAAVIGYRNAGLKYKGWMTALDQRVCPVCFNNEFEAPGVPRIVPIDELFPSGDPWPPAHPHCRCATIPVFDPFGEPDIVKSVLSYLEWNVRNPLHVKDPLGRWAQGGHGEHVVDSEMRDGIVRVGAGRVFLPKVRDRIEGAYTGEFGNLSTKNVSVKVNEEHDIEIKGLIYTDTGEEVGQFMRTIRATEPPEAHHDWLNIDGEFQGQGFAQAFNAHLYDQYRTWGIEEVHLAANIDVGGYAWARAGYDWASRNSRSNPYARLREFVDPPALSEIDDDLPEPWSPISLIPVERLEEQREAARRMIERFGSTVWGAEDYPTPFELAQLGRWDGATGEEGDWWIGKAVMMGSSWSGVKRL